MGFVNHSSDFDGIAETLTLMRIVIGGFHREAKRASRIREEGRRSIPQGRHTRSLLMTRRLASQIDSFVSTLRITACGRRVNSLLLILC